MDLATLQARKHKITFDIDGEAVTIEIQPHKITPEYQARLTKLAAEDSGQDDDVTMLAELIVSWDVTCGGEPYLPTYENLLKAPRTLITRAVVEILEAVGKLAIPPKPKK